MRPVAIFRHAPNEGPGYFAIFLEQQGIPWEMIAVDEGENIPLSSSAYAGLCFMGGPMSVNDPLPWLDDACQLIRDAAAHNIPVIGHCLGGQLMSKAMGGTVFPNPVKEIGWGEVFGENTPLAHNWLGDLAGQGRSAFHWHGETFSLPSGAGRLMASMACANQMFALGPHLGMQCHIEMTPEMIANWCSQWPDETRDQTLATSIQAPDAILAEQAHRLPALRRLADQLYGVWVRGLVR